MHNVKITTAANNNVLAYTLATDIWENKTVESALGFTPVVANSAITGATKTKITYDAKGLVTVGADATTADIADSTNKRYVTDANLTVIGNTSGTNTGDNATNSQYSGLATSKQDTLVSGTNIKTINSTTLLGSGDITTGTVTSVAALTLGTTGTDLTSSVATGTTTPVITLNVPTASAANRGALSSSDWTTFNSKQKAITSGTASPTGGSDGDIYLQYV